MESIESPSKNLYADLTATQQIYQESSYITPLTNHLTDDQIARERERSRLAKHSESESAKGGIYTGLSNDYFSFEGNEDYQVPQNDQLTSYMELKKSNSQKHF